MERKGEEQQQQVGESSSSIFDICFTIDLDSCMLYCFSNNSFGWTMKTDPDRFMNCDRMFCPTFSIDRQQCSMPHRHSHIVHRQVDFLYDVISEPIIIARPYFREFYQTVRAIPNAKVVIWSAAQKTYVHAIVDYFLRDLPLPDLVWSKGHCQFFLDENGEESCTKPLHKLAEYFGEKDISKFIIIDDNKISGIYNPHNMLYIRPFECRHRNDDSDNDDEENDQEEEEEDNHHGVDNNTDVLQTTMQTSIINANDATLNETIFQKKIKKHKSRTAMAKTAEGAKNTSLQQQDARKRKQLALEVAEHPAKLTKIKHHYYTNIHDWIEDEDGNTLKTLANIISHTPTSVQKIIGKAVAMKIAKPMVTRMRKQRSSIKRPVSNIRTTTTIPQTPVSDFEIPISYSETPTSIPTIGTEYHPQIQMESFTLHRQSRRYN